MAHPNPIAIEFVQYVLQTQSVDSEFIILYDALHRTAMHRKFRNLGLGELANIGISFSLLNTAQLESLISQARLTMEIGVNS